MANLNYVGSLAQERMKFRSTAEVVTTITNELFHAMSIYIPKRFAQANIIDWDNSYVTGERPAVFTVVVDNYTKFMKGDLLNQWQPIFRQDTNSSVILYLIVFEDGQQSGWEIQNRDISYAPLTAAFNALFSFSYFKFLFDPSYDGKPVTLLPDPGSPAEMSFILINETSLGSFARETVQFQNASASPILLPANSQYQFNDGSKQWRFPITEAKTLAAAGNTTAQATSTVNGADLRMFIGREITEFFAPAMPPEVRVVVQAIQQGSTGTPAQPGTPTTLTVTFTNNGQNTADFPSGLNFTSIRGVNYTVDGGTVAPIPSGGQAVVAYTAQTVGPDTSITNGLDLTSLLASKLPTDPGTKTAVEVIITNNGHAPATLSGTSFTSSNGTVYTADNPIPTILAGQMETVYFTATSIGPDPSLSNGADITTLFSALIPTDPGAATTFSVEFSNSSGSSITVPSGQILTTGAGAEYASNASTSVPAGGTSTVAFTGVALGADAAISSGTNITSWYAGGAPSGLTGAITGAVTQGWAAAKRCEVEITDLTQGLAPGIRVSAIVSGVVAGTTPTPDTGTKTILTIQFINTGKNGQSLPTSGVTLNDGNVASLTYNVGVPMQTVLLPGGIFEINVTALTVGEDTQMAEGKEITGLFTGNQQPPLGTRSYTINTENGLNPGQGTNITVSAGTYIYNDGIKSFPIVVSQAGVLPANGTSQTIKARATTVGEDANLAIGIIDSSKLAPQFPQGITVQAVDMAQGQNAIGPGPTDVPSQYFDLSLALAVLCKNNISLSWFWSLVRTTFADDKPSSQDACWLVYRTRAQQLESMTSLLTGDRNRYYWAALYLLGCQNTTLLVHSEPENIVVDVLAAWFGARNDSGTFVGNKLSLLRLNGTRIKAFGYPSWLDSSVNENAADYHQQLRDMEVGFLSTISDNSIQDCYLSAAHGISTPGNGLPVTMMMIAKFVDYTCSMEVANLVTDKGTLTNPVLTDITAYEEIQRIVKNTLSRFAGTAGRLFAVALTFPSFEAAKVSRTALSAATAWHANYKDDLDSVEVSGGITAE